MKIRFLVLFAVPILMLPAQETPTITIRKSDSINLSISPVSGPGGEAVTSVLKNDLGVSGWFTIGGSGAYTVSGAMTGGGLQGEVKDQSGGVVLSKTYGGGSRAMAHAFADDIVETIAGQPGIASTKIGFVSTRTGRKEIYTADYDGANVQQLTSDGVISVAPALSPDGRKLAYTGYQSGYADIYLIDVASGSRNRIVKFPGTNSGAAFSPDGARIACSISKDGNPEIYVVGANGSGAKRLTRTRGVESSPSWSPDGSEIVFSSDEGGNPRLFRISSSGGSERPISTGHGFCTEPSWSPDGKKIAYTVRNSGIAVTDLSTGSTRVVTSGGEDPVWGADSRHLIYSTGSSLVLLDVPSGKSTAIVTDLGKVTEPTWSRE